MHPATAACNQSRPGSTTIRCGLLTLEALASDERVVDVDEEEAEQVSPLSRVWTTFPKLFLSSVLPLVALPSSIPAQASLIKLFATTLLLPDEGAQRPSRWIPDSVPLSTRFELTLLLLLHTSIPSKSCVSKTVLRRIVLLSAGPAVR